MNRPDDLSCPASNVRMHARSENIRTQVARLLKSKELGTYLLSKSGLRIDIK